MRRAKGSSRKRRAAVGSTGVEVSSGAGSFGTGSVAAGNDGAVGDDGGVDFGRTYLIINNMTIDIAVNPTTAKANDSVRRN